MKFPRYALNASRVRFGVASVAAVGLLVALPLSAQAATRPVPLGTAGSFAVLAGQTVTNTGATTITGDLGVHPGSSITGMNTVTLHGATHVADAVALAAQTDLGTAYDNVAGQTPATAIPSELGGTTLVPGIYSSGVFTITNTLTLDARGDPNAIFVFQSAATLTAESGSTVRLIGRASPCNVFWLVPSSATLNTTATFVGNILASTSIFLRTGATVQGRVLARTGEVTLDANTITRPVCAAATPTATPTPSTQATQAPTGAVASGDGSTSGGTNDSQGFLAGAMLFAGVGGAAVVAVRRRRRLNA